MKTDEEKVRELARALGWERINDCCGAYLKSTQIMANNDWNPFESRDDLEALQKEICFLDKEEEYIKKLLSWADRQGPIGEVERMLLPVPIHAEAAWQVLCGEEGNGPTN